MRMGAGLCFGLRAQLVRLRPDQNQGALVDEPRGGRHARLLPRGSASLLHLKDKMQSAGYSEKLEKWDSDSDSDEADEEDLKV